MIMPSGWLGEQTFSIIEEERQALLLALARLAVDRPGWLSLLRQIAGKFSGAEMFDNFRTYAGVPPGWPKDSSNQFEVVRQGEMVVVLKLDPMNGRHVLTLEEALRLAVPLALLADPELREFNRLSSEYKK